MDEDLIVKALGLESAYGYHIETAPRSPVDVHVSDAAAASRYPCLTAEHVYTGCLGEACPLQMCWTGTPTLSYMAALQRRFHPADDIYVRGARCMRCKHVEEISVSVLDQQREMKWMSLRRCGQGRWTHPISASALARRRIPAHEDTDLAHCPGFAPVDESCEDDRRPRNRRGCAQRVLGEERHE